MTNLAQNKNIYMYLHVITWDDRDELLLIVELSYLK